MKPSDLNALINVAQPAVSPDGTKIAFVVVRVDEEENSYRSQIWLTPSDGSAPPRPFTSGEYRDGNPTWSPDGSLLAYTAERTKGDKTQATIRIVPVTTGGELVTVATLKEGAEGLTWSPDGRLLAFATRTRAERYVDDDPKKQPPRRITRLFSRLDSNGFTADRPKHVYVVPADGSEQPRNLTEGDFEFAEPAWTPGSAGLVVSGAGHDTWDLDLKSDLYAIDVASGERTAITSTTGVFGSPSVSPDGTRLAFLGMDDAKTYPRNGHVAVISTDGGQHQWISTALDRTFTPFPGAQSPQWVDESSLLVTAEDRGDVHLYQLAADGASPPKGLWTGTGCVTGFDHRSGTIAFTLSTPTRAGELYVVEDGGELRQLTNITAAFATQAQLQPYETFTFTSTDGTVELDGWILRPDGFDPSESYPALVNVHGGPFTQYANRFFDEVQMQARAGYVVMWCNPRGSSGREESFGRAICGPPIGGTGWGSVDYDDVISLVDHAVTTYSFIDPDRLGILGGSYGGYMTSWAIGQTDRFAAAVSERSANNLLSLEWASDAASAFRTFVGASHLDAPELYQAMSPMTHVKNITTPLLIVHSEDDLRCPIEQAEQLFVALRTLERDVEFVRFPGESHELSRSGSPVHRRQRAEIILEFFDKHLKPSVPAE